MSFNQKLGITHVCVQTEMKGGDSVGLIKGLALLHGIRLLFYHC